MFKIAIAQLRLHPGCDEHMMDRSTPPGVTSNLEAAAGWVARGREAGAELIGFGEWFVGLNALAPLPNPLTERFSDLARQHGVTLVLGNLRIPVGEHDRESVQSSLVISPQGEIAGQQRKVQLYAQERPWYQAGSEVTPLDLPWGRLVVTSGLDSVSPQVYEQVKRLRPALWIAQANDLLTPEDYGHQAPDLETLIRQRSAELEATVALAMMLGDFREMQFSGGSLIARRGDVVGRLGEEEGLLTAELEELCD